MPANYRANRLSALSAAIVAALVTLPIVTAIAGEPEKANKTAAKGGKSAVAPVAVLRGRVTDEDEAPLADVRVRVAIPATGMRFFDPRKDKSLETTTDANGDYRLELPGVIKPTIVSLDAMKRGYRRLVGTMMSGGDARKAEVTPGTTADALPLVLKPALYFAGVVVDEAGKPISGVDVWANAVTPRSSGGVEKTVTNSAGTFELFNYSLEPQTLLGNGVTAGRVGFFHPDYVGAKIRDVYAIEEEKRDEVRVVLPTGYKIAGTVLDAAGKPVPNAIVKSAGPGNRKAMMTDGNGKFLLRGLTEGATTLSARSLRIKQKAQLQIALKSDKKDLQVRLQPISLPADLKTYSVLGMQLADVTPQLQSAYDLHSDHGALILDPGNNFERLNIGELEEGDCFWIVGQKQVGSVAEFAKEILAEAARQHTDVPRVCVVYWFRRVEFDGTNTQYLKLTPFDIEQLRLALARFIAGAK